MSNTVGVLGCGWLGLPLAESFLDKGYKVHGSTTSKEKLNSLEKAGIRPFLISLAEDGVNGDMDDFLFGVDTLVINVPPGLRSGRKENYVKKMQFLYDTIKASDTKKIVFVSSTSVYGQIEGEVTEDTVPRPQTESGMQLLASENIFIKDSELKTTIVRFGGLIGPKRHPITRLAGKKQLSNGNDAVNLIHLDDCIEIIASTVKHKWWNEIFNGVYPHHPLKKEYYPMEAQKRGLSMPEYEENNRKMGKKIDSRRLIHVKKFHFKTSISG